MQKTKAYLDQLTPKVLPEKALKAIQEVKLSYQEWEEHEGKKPPFYIYTVPQGIKVEVKLFVTYKIAVFAIMGIGAVLFAFKDYILKLF